MAVTGRDPVEGDLFVYGDSQEALLVLAVMYDTEWKIFYNG